MEVNDILSILNTVEEDIQSIRLSEDLLTIQQDSELSESRKDNLKKNMNLFNETLKKNRLKLVELQEKLNVSSINSSSLQKTIERLTKEMNEKSEYIVMLNNELDKKEVHIEALTSQIEELHTGMKNLEEINQSHVDQINEQEEELNTVYYCFGTRKELKEQNILTGGGMFSKTKALQGDFGRDYFMATDKRALSFIPLFSSKATILTNHPAGSYRLVKDSDRHLTLEISNPAAFWSSSHYLVIEVK